jgi:CRISPR-associated protein Cmr4
MPENKQAAGLLFLHAQTGLHPGSGTALGVVDLPVQRERHTQWPTIPGSALKGVLRDLCREAARPRYRDRQEANEKDPDLVAAFGPGKIDESNAHAGALSLTDARILAFPVRSLRGVFAWVTCPDVLSRLDRDLRLAQQNLPSAKLYDNVDRNHARCPAGSPLRVSGDRLVLEEFEFTCSDDGTAANWVANYAVGKETAERVRKHLVVLSNDDFTHFVRHATEVVARVGLDYDRKTVKDGALFYQEFLPPETLFYSVVLAADSRFADHKRSGPEMLDYLDGQLKAKQVLQIGGDETTGKGLCLAQLMK